MNRHARQSVGGERDRRLARALGVRPKSGLLARARSAATRLRPSSVDPGASKRRCAGGSAGPGGGVPPRSGSADLLVCVSVGTAVGGAGWSLAGTSDASRRPFAGDQPGLQPLADRSVVDGTQPLPDPFVRTVVQCLSGAAHDALVA